MSDLVAEIVIRSAEIDVVIENPPTVWVTFGQILNSGPSEDLTGPPGPQGIAGIQGPVGPQGIQGFTGAAEQWFSSAAAPLTSSGSVGDWHLNFTTGDVYEKTGASIWTLRANIKGPVGNQGPAGGSGGVGNSYFGQVARPITFGKAVQGQGSVGGTSTAYGYGAYGAGVYSGNTAPVDPPPVDPPPGGGTVYLVPTNIDKTGTNDVTSALASWIASVPNGTAGSPNTLRFGGGTYRIHTMLTISNRSYLTFDCTAATTFRHTTPVTLSGADYVGNDSYRNVRVADCNNIQFKGFTFIGASPMPASGDGFHAWEANVQHIHNLNIARCTNMLIENCIIDGSGGGDGINWGNEDYGVRSTGIIRNTIIRNAHRCGIALVGSGGLSFIGGTIERTGAWDVDLEPNTFNSGNYNTLFDGVTFGSRAGLVVRPAFLAFAGSKDGNGECVNLTVKNCTGVNRALEIRLNSIEYGQSPHELRLQNVRLENITGNSGGRLECNEVDTLWLVNNTITRVVTNSTDVHIV